MYINELNQYWGSQTLCGPLKIGLNTYIPRNMSWYLLSPEYRLSQTAKSSPAKTSWKLVQYESMSSRVTKREMVHRSLASCTSFFPSFKASLQSNFTLKSVAKCVYTYSSSKELGQVEGSGGGGSWGGCLYTNIRIITFVLRHRRRVGQVVKNGPLVHGRLLNDSHCLLRVSTTTLT